MNQIKQLGFGLLSLIILTLSVCLDACTKDPSPREIADIIYIGGDIITINDAQPTAEALAIKEGKIIAVGTEPDILKHKASGTKLVDLEGKTLLPGFIDAHGHVLNSGLSVLAANLLPPPDGTVNNIESLLEALGQWVKQHPEPMMFTQTGWIVGFGYDDAQLAERRHPTRDDLDKVSTTIPIITVHQSGHLGVFNSKGLELANITAATKDPHGGVIRRKKGSSEPNGVLEETAFFEHGFEVLGKLGHKGNKALLKAGVDLYTSFGFTTAQEGRATAEVIETETAVAAEGGIKIDIVAYSDIEIAVDTIKPPSLAKTYTNHFRIGGAKLNLDGSPQGKTAWLTEPYKVPPAGQPADYLGYPAMSDEKAIAFVDKAFAKGWQILTHCNGDAAADQLIKAVRAATEKYGKADRRPVMIHAQTVREDQLDSMKKLGIIPSFFGMHTYYWGDWHRDSVLGPERAARISPAASTLKRSMIFTEHHDAPVALPNSIIILASAVNRTTRSNQVLGLEQRISVMDALKSITIHAAYQHFEEDTKGSLEPGKLADLVILDKNPLKIEPSALWEIRVLETIKEGEPIYAAP